MVPGMRLRNLWEELSTLPEQALSTVSGDKNITGTFTPIPVDEQQPEEISKGSLGRRVRLDAASDKTLQVDYFRPDGSLFVRISATSTSGAQRAAG